LVHERNDKALYDSAPAALKPYRVNLIINW